MRTARIEAIELAAELRALISVRTRIKSAHDQAYFAVRLEEMVALAKQVEALDDDLHRVGDALDAARNRADEVEESEALEAFRDAWGDELRDAVEVA